MKMLIEGLKPTEPKEPKVEFEYSDLEDFDGKSIYYTYSVPYDKVIDALAYLDKLPEDITDEQIIEDIDEYVDQNYDELLDYFRDDAQEDAYENYEEDDPRWDEVDRAYDEYRDSLLED